MIAKSFSVAWETFKRHVPTFLGLCIINVLITGVGQAFIRTVFPPPEGFNPYDVMAMLTSGYTSIGGLLGTLWSFVSFVLQIGLLWAALRAVRGQEPAISDLFSQMPRIVQATLLSLLITVATTVGFALLVVPGIYIGLGFLMAPLIFADRELGAVDSLRASWALMNGHRWEGLAFVIAMLAAIVAGALACGVGLFVAFPVVILALAAFYDQLRGSSEPVPPPMPTLDLPAA